MAYQVDYYIHVDSKEAALDLITHLPFNGNLIDTAEVADYAGPAIEQAINQIVQVTKMENINEHINEIRESVKGHLADFLRTYGIMLNDLKVLIMPKDERMRELISLQAIGPDARSRRCATTWRCEWPRRDWSPRPTRRRACPYNIGGQPRGLLSAGFGIRHQINVRLVILRCRPTKAGGSQPVLRLGL